MTTVIGTPGAVDSALRRSFSDASVRLQPETKMTDIIAAFSAMGIDTAVDDGLLVLKQGSTVFHIGQALRSFAAKPEHAQFFIIETDDPKTWTNQRKMAFIRENGDVAWGKKCAAPVLEAGIRTLDANMSRHDYLKLTRAEKIAFINEYGDAAVARVMGKAK